MHGQMAVNMKGGGSEVSNMAMGRMSGAVKNSNMGSGIWAKEFNGFLLKTSRKYKMVSSTM